jgi:hypothetical protein
VRDFRIFGALSQNRACRSVWTDVELRDQWGVAKSYRPVLRDQPMLLPVDMREWLPGDHLVWFVLETVDVLDVDEFEHGSSGWCRCCWV